MSRWSPEGREVHRQKGLRIAATFRNQTFIESQMRVAERKRLAAMAPVDGAPVAPGALPPRRHDPADPECVCDACDPEEP